MPLRGRAALLRPTLVSLLRVLALCFEPPWKVFAASMSSAPGQQQVIAVGNDSPQARLCDIRTGAFAHMLTGHSEAVWACAWSPRSSFLLATASADHTVRCCPLSPPPMAGGMLGR